MKERRKTKRFIEKNKAVINFSIQKASIDRKTNLAWTRDLSIDGAKLRTQKTFPQDTRLIISLELPKSKQVVKLWARVIWAQKMKKKGEFVLGVEFIHSLETIPDLFKHLYGFSVPTKKKNLPRKRKSFSVEVTEA